MIQEHTALQFCQMLSYRGKMIRQEYDAKMQEIREFLRQNSAKPAGPVICGIHRTARGMIANMEILIPLDTPVPESSPYSARPELSLTDALFTHYSGPLSGIRQCLGTLNAKIQTEHLTTASETCWIVFENFESACNSAQVEADFYVEIEKEPTQPPEPDFSAETRGTFRRLGFSLLTIAAVAIGAQFLILLFSILASLMSWTPIPQTSWSVWLLTFLPIYALAMPLGLLVMKKCPAQPGTPEKLGAKRFWVLFFACFPMMYAGNAVGSMISQFVSFGSSENALVDYAMDMGISKIIVMVILAPLLEEFIFRKQLIDRSLQYGERTAIVFSALAFGLFHMNFYQFFYASALGLVFGYTYVRTRRLRYSVIMHMAVNFLGAVIAPWVISHIPMERLSSLTQEDVNEALFMELLPVIFLLLGYALFLLALCLTGAVLIVLNAKNIRFSPAEKEMAPKKQIPLICLNGGVLSFIILCVLMFGFNLIFS